MGSWGLQPALSSWDCSGWGCRWGGRVPAWHKILSLRPSIYKPDVVPLDCNPSIWEVEARRSIHDLLTGIFQYWEAASSRLPSNTWDPISDIKMGVGGTAEDCHPSYRFPSHPTVACIALSSTVKLASRKEVCRLVWDWFLEVLEPKYMVSPTFGVLPCSYSKLPNSLCCFRAHWGILD